MIATVDLRGTRPTPSELLTRLPRARVDVSAAVEVAAELIAAVRAHGKTALLDQAQRFDGIRPRELRVPVERITHAVDELAPDVRAALEQSIARVRVVSAAQIPPALTTDLGRGASVTQRWVPVARAGLYVPGGKAAYPSSVVMNVVPAQEAGVRSVALASPPQRGFDGQVHPVILGAAGLLGVEEVYAIGGAGAIGALAYGVPDVPIEPVQVITGPGNVYVVAAKRLVRGVVGIDSEAGTTEILVIADDGADAHLIAADLVSQAEHDEAAAAVLVTDSPALAERVCVGVAAQAATTRHSARVTTALDGPQSAIVLVDDLAAAAAFSNAYGPEHLELHTRDADGLLASIENAGAVFVGPYAPVSLGDYLAGSNHVLPTGGAARFSSGLGAYSFLRAQQVIRYERDALADVAGGILALSAAEDLPAHGDAVSARFADSAPAS